MESYYQKIKKKSISTTLIGIGIALVGMYIAWAHIWGAGASNKDHVLIAGIGIVVVCFGLFMIIVSLRGVQILKRRIGKLGLREDIVAADLAGGADFSECNVGEKYAIQCDSNPDIILLEGALTVRMETESTTSKGYTSYSYYVWVTEHSGATKRLSAESEEEMRRIFDQIVKKRPWVITEEDSAIRELRKKNLPELVRIVDGRKAQYESEYAGGKRIE